ncbi:MAG: polysaccharide deacetylase family protein [Candidatus Brocadia sp.]|nr:polysaccharide deacetylase family protein [Candidatus Brocadia sp.]
MKLPGTTRIKKGLQILKKRLVSSSLVLMYHRITDIKTDPWSLCVTPQHFSEHLEVLQKCARTLRLDQLAHYLRRGKIPRRSVIITFDDGYADNLHTAKPLLERYDTPATFFLTTGCIERHREFWWDELDRLILQPVRLPETLELSIRGKIYEWHLSKDVQYNEDIVHQNNSWRAWEKAPSIRHEIYYVLWNLLKPLDENEQQDVLNQLITWVGAEPSARSTHRLLLPEEIKLFGKGNLFEVGAHSVTHASLPAQPIAFQQHEILQSKAYLDDLLKNPVASFSYPYGDYTAETIALVKEAGFSCACSTKAGVISSKTDSFQLPRFEVLDWNGEEFEKQLLKWRYQ